MWRETYNTNNKQSMKRIMESGKEKFKDLNYASKQQANKTIIIIYIIIVVAVIIIIAIIYVA